MLVLSNDDAPAVTVNDNWRADPALAFTCKVGRGQVVLLTLMLC